MCKTFNGWGDQLASEQSLDVMRLKIFVKKLCAASACIVCIACWYSGTRLGERGLEMHDVERGVRARDAHTPSPGALRSKK